MTKSHRLQPGRDTQQLAEPHRKSRQDRPKKIRRDEKRLRKKEAKWEWRKKYRVWETNRKVFVYPQNWIEPDLVLPIPCLVALRPVVAAVRAQCAARSSSSTHKQKICARRGFRTNSDTEIA